jgi:hypothetical protein
MSPALGVIIMMNNYFHDVATALLLASGIAIWVIMRSLGDCREEPVINYFLSIYRGMTRLAGFSLIWIIIGGIPRTIFYKELEWASAAGKSQIPALIVKHMLAFTFVGAGIYLWLRLSKKVKRLKEDSNLA